MNKNATSLLPINKKDYIIYRDNITFYLKNIDWKTNIKEREYGDNTFLKNINNIYTENKQVSIIKSFVKISNDSIILSNTCNYILNTIREAYCISYYIAELYSKSSGLDKLIEKNKNSNLFQSELPEFHKKMETKSAIIQYCASSYINYELDDYMNEAQKNININFNKIPEINLSKPSTSLECTMFYYGLHLELPEYIKYDNQLLKFTYLYFEKLKSEILFIKNTFEHIQYFTNFHYKLEDSEFVIRGFEQISSNNIKTIEFNKVKMEEIVGNTSAKHQYKRLVERLLCYDINARKNPILEFGKMPMISMGDGKPGTGKSMLISAVATMLQEKCDELEVPFLFWPLPDNIISTYQGGSAERALDWFKPLNSNDKIIFAPIDDAENNLEDRNRKSVSAGVREFIGVFLRNTEGAYAVNNGNKLISLFTNIPEQIDKAILSRIQSRVPIEGALTKEDFIDQDYIWWKTFNNIDNNFVDMKNPVDYSYLSNQVDYIHNPEKEVDYKIQNEDLQEIFEFAKSKYDIDKQEFFGEFYIKILQKWKYFSSRDIRNIQNAINSKLMDFDFPDEWWNDKNIFFKKDYDTKVMMLKSQIVINMKELKFSEIRLNESLFYIDNMIRINENGTNREIIEMANQMYINSEATKLYNNINNKNNKS